MAIGDITVTLCKSGGTNSITPGTDVILRIIASNVLAMRVLRELVMELMQVTYKVGHTQELGYMGVYYVEMPQVLIHWTQLVVLSTLMRTISLVCGVLQEVVN